MVTGDFKGAQWKMTLQQLLYSRYIHARAACQQAIIKQGEGYCAKNKEWMGVHGI